MTKHKLPNQDYLFNKTELVIPKHFDVISFTNRFELYNSAILTVYDQITANQASHNSSYGLMHNSK